MIAATLMQAVAVAADQQAKSPNGALGLLVFLIVALAVVFLLRSMVKQLNKVKKINFDEPPKSAEDGPLPRRRR